MNILIVEDDQVLSLILKQKIEHMGYNVLDSATKGIEAVEKALASEYDLLLMDIMLTDNIDGIEAYKQIKHNKDIPVIYITGNSDPLHRRRAEQLGYHDYLLKPIDFEELQSSIHKLAMKR